MPRKKPVVSERKITVGPCTIIATATGNPLQWNATERATLDKVQNALDALEKLNPAPAAAEAKP